MAPAVSFSVVASEKMSLADVSSDNRQPASTHRKLYGIKPTQRTDNHSLLTTVTMVKTAVKMFSVY